MSAAFHAHDLRQGVPEKLEALVAPHVDSFDYFADQGLKAAFDRIAPVEVHDPAKRLQFKIWVENPRLFRPYSEDGSQKPVYPSECRQAGTTYRGDFRMDLCVTHFAEDHPMLDGRGGSGGGIVQRMPCNMGRLPIMVKSSLCHLRNLTQEQLVRRKEESLEMGGYFICNGIERLMRLLILPRRNYPMAISRSSFLRKGEGFSNKAVSIRCVRPDQTAQTVRLVYVNEGTAVVNFSLRKREYFVPLGIILKALVEISDAELYGHICASSFGAQSEDSAATSASNGAGEHAMGGRGEFMEADGGGDLVSSGEKGRGDAEGDGDMRQGSQLVQERALLTLGQPRAHQLYTRMQCVSFLGERFRSMLELPERLTDAQAGEKLLRGFILVHLEDDQQKLALLIFMLQKLYAFVDGTAQEDNADALQHHEILLPGHLLLMFIKERVQTFLGKIGRLAQKEIGDKSGRVDLRTRGFLAKLLEGCPLTVGKDVEYLLNTGNLASPSGLDLQQKSGFTLVAEKLNFLRYISHFRSVHRGAFFAQLRTTSVRKLLPESWGFMCPVHTPDGAPCGLLNHLSSSCHVTTHLMTATSPKDPAAIRACLAALLASLGMRPACLGLPMLPAPEFLTVLLDGEILGQIHCALAEPVVRSLRQCKSAAEPGVPQDLEVAYIPFSALGTFPGIFLFSGPARFSRPVRQLLGPVHVRGRTKAEEKPLEFIGSLEQVFMNVLCQDGGRSSLGVAPGVGGPFTHEEIDPTAMLSVVASLTPWSDFNQSPRNMYQCQMGKQTMGMPLHTFPYRWDNKLYRLQTPQTPIARTKAYDQYCMDDFPTGINAVVAVLAYTGYDMEDAMIINKSSMERGFAHGSLYKTEELEANPRLSGTTLPNAFRRARYQHADTVDRDGLPKVGQRLKPDDAYCSIMNTMTGQPEKIVKLKGADEAVVDGVCLIGVGAKAPGLQKVNIRLRFGRRPQIGDKFSSRHGQKGVLSQLWPDEDMPFSHASGMRPDIIINPHAFPSRMTIGMLFESMAAKSGSLHGEFVNASTFRTCADDPEALIRPHGPHQGKKRTTKGKQQRVPEDGAAAASEEAEAEGGSLAEVFGKKLVAKGFDYYGTETMYSGVYGTEMDCHIYMGVVYYQRLRHMVSDKFQVRSTGPVNPLTQQPVKGRSKGGGIRFGEMERDALLSHGAAYLLHDRLHVCSDYHTADLCSTCGSLLSPLVKRSQRDGRIPSSPALGLGLGSAPNAAGSSQKRVCQSCGTSRGVVRVAMPFVFRYLAAELAAMNIKLTLGVK